MNVVRYAGLQYEHDDSLTHLWHVEREGIHYLLYFKGGGTLSYDAKSAGTEAEISVAFDKEIARQESGTYHNEVWTVVTETMDSKAKRTLDIFEHPTWGVDWAKIGGSISDEAQFCDMLERQVDTWKGTAHSLPVAKHPYWPTFHEMVKDAVADEFGSSVRLYRGIHGEQAISILNGEPVKNRAVSSWTSDLQGARVYAAGKTKHGGKDWVVIQRNFSPEEIALAPVTLDGPCENPDILMRLMYDVEHSGDEFIVSLRELVPGDYKIAAKPRGKVAESTLRTCIRKMLSESFQHQGSYDYFRVELPGIGYAQGGTSLRFKECQSDVDKIKQSPEYLEAEERFLSDPKNVWGDGSLKKFAPRFYDVSNAWIHSPKNRGKGHGKEIYKAFIDKAVEYSRSYGAVFVGAHHCTLGSGTSQAAKRVWKSITKDYTSSGDVIFIGL